MLYNIPACTESFIRSLIHSSTPGKQYCFNHMTVATFRIMVPTQQWPWPNVIESISGGHNDFVQVRCPLTSARLKELRKSKSIIHSNKRTVRQSR